jgi:hypothetical protein
MNHIAYSLLDQTEQLAIKRDNDFDSEVHRLEHKLDLVIQMLGQLLHTQQTRPASVLLRLGAETIAWRHPAAKVGEQYRVTLFLYESIALPVQAIVEIKDVEEDWCTAQFVSQSSDEQSAWERWVFRQHRRQVAHNRDHSVQSR